MSPWICQNHPSLGVIVQMNTCGQIGERKMQISRYRHTPELPVLALDTISRVLV